MKYITVEKFEVNKTSFLNEYFYSASIKLVKVTLNIYNVANECCSFELYINQSIPK